MAGRCSHIFRSCSPAPDARTPGALLEEKHKTVTLKTAALRAGARLACFAAVLVAAQLGWAGDSWANSCRSANSGHSDCQWEQNVGGGNIASTSTTVPPSSGDFGVDCTSALCSDGVRLDSQDVRGRHVNNIFFIHRFHRSKPPTCHVISNNSSNDIFVPQASESEFSSFLNNLPIGVTASSCATSQTITATASYGNGFEIFANGGPATTSTQSTPAAQVITLPATSSSSVTETATFKYTREDCIAGVAASSSTCKANQIVETQTITVPVTAASYNIAQATVVSSFTVNGVAASSALADYNPPSASTGPTAVNGQCGAANGVSVSSAPAAGLCTAGTASSVATGTSSFTWSCAGSNGGTNASCSAPLSTSTQAVNGQCGSTNGTTTNVTPTTGFCSTGTASSVSGSGPWAWTCAGSNGGTTASCAASAISVVSSNGSWPGQTGNPVGYAAYAPLGTTPWPSGQKFVSGTAANPTIYKGYVFTGGQNISGSYIEFISCDFNSGTGGVNVSGSNITFIGDRFQSNDPPNYNVQTSGTNLVFQYDSFTPLASLYTAPPGAAWPSAGAGQNTDTQTAGVNAINGNDGYQYGLSINSGGPVTVDHSDFWGFGNDAIQWMTTTAQMTITNNWMHDAANASPQGYHQDGLGYVNGAGGPSNILIQGNTIASIGNTNAIAFQAATSGYNNIQIIHNYISGFGYTVAPGTPGNTRFTNSSFTYNVFGTDIEDVWGPLYGPPGSGTTWKCNTINIASGTNWTNGNNWKPTAAMNGEYWVPTSSIASATDYNGNTSCPPLTGSTGGTAVNGVCGAANGVAVSGAPASGLCTGGTASSVTGSGPFAWTCAGSNGGTTASCSAPLSTTTQAVNGQCGAANGVSVSSKPTTGLCTTGTASSVASGTSSFTWSCAGSNGGVTASCSAPVTTVTQAVNGQCGAANGVSVSSKPTTGLCTTGTASTVATGTSSFTWSCPGSNGGTNASCSAPVATVSQAVNGQCGSANAVGTNVAPTSGLCIAGAASTLSGSGPWSWSCAGSNGGSTAQCSDTLLSSTGGNCAHAMNGYADGCAQAAAGVVPFPSMLNGYKVRPTWDVAGVDYYVGVPSNVSPIVPTSANLPSGCSMSGSSVTCSGSTPIVLNGFNFTNISLKISASNITVENSLFVVGSAQGSLGNIINVTSAAGNVTFLNNEVNGNNIQVPAQESATIEIENVGTITLEYNYFHNSGGDMIDFSGGPQVETIRYNLFKDIGLLTAHSDTVQWCGSKITSADLGFNVIDQTKSGLSGEGLLMPNSECTGASMSNLLEHNNTLISLVQDNFGVGDDVTQDAGAATGSNISVFDNFIDPTGIDNYTGSPWFPDGSYGVALAQPSSMYGLINMVNGSTIPVATKSAPTSQGYYTYPDSAGFSPSLIDAQKITASGSSVTLAMDETWNVTGSPVITLSNGATATYASGSGSASLVFSITSGSAASGVTITALNLNGGNIKDNFGNPVNLGVTATNAGSSGSTGGTTPTPVNGACGSSNGATVASKPTTGLCTTGTASSVSGSGPFNWSCAGSNGGSTAQCTAAVTSSGGSTAVSGVCGASNNVAMTSKPTSGLCTTGTASTVAGSGPWTWTCAGSNGGATASCTAPLSVVTQAVNGACGTANGVSFSSAPTANLCSAGTATVVTGTGPFSWGCEGINGGANALCSANLLSVVSSNGNWPGQSNNPVGYAVVGPLGTTPWPGGAFVSGTTANPTVYTGYVFTGSQSISGSNIEFVSCDFNLGVGQLNVSGSNISFTGSRFQSNQANSYNVLTTGTNLVFSYDSFTPLASLYTAPPGAAWPSAGAGMNTTTQVTGVNAINGNDGYQYGLSINGGGPVSVDHSDFWGFGNDAIQWMTTTAQMNITNNWMHDTANASPQGYHQDGIGYVNGAGGPSNILIQGNTIASLGNTNAIAFQGATSGYNNIQIFGNYISGYGYTTAVAGFTNSTFADNVFGTDIANVFGPLYGWTTGNNNTWKCNTINVVPGTTWTDEGEGLGSWTPTASDNGKFWIPTSSIDSATDYLGNTSCP